METDLVLTQHIFAGPLSFDTNGTRLSRHHHISCDDSPPILAIVIAVMLLMHYLLASHKKVQEFYPQF